MMEWTRVKPSQEGWYWWRSVDKCAAMIVRIILAGQGDRERWCVVDEGDLEDLHSRSGEWSSEPIAEPNLTRLAERIQELEHRLDGLRARLDRL